VVQLAPYNTQYERLPLHLSIAGVTPEPNLWDKPVTLAREHGRATPDSGTDIPGGTATPKARDPVQLLPPERLVPFMVPFQGGRGPMCGGAASSGATRWEPHLHVVLIVEYMPTPGMCPCSLPRLVCMGFGHPPVVIACLGASNACDLP
jgi:hypothetical protein